MRSVAVLVGLLPLLAPAPASSAASCALLPPADGTLVGFGNYNALLGDVDGIGQIRLLCVPDLLEGLPVSYTLAADAGTGSGGSFSPRRLTDGGYGLDYNMYLDASHTQVFGDGSVGTHTAAGSCSATCTVMVYGRIFGGQSVPSGPYQDSIVVTLDF